MFISQNHRRMIAIVLVLLFLIDPLSRSPLSGLLLGNQGPGQVYAALPYQEPVSVPPKPFQAEAHVVYLPTISQVEIPASTECVPSPAGESGSLDDALIICHDQQISASVALGDRRDVYKIAVEANRQIKVAMTGTGDADLELFPPGTTDLWNDFPVLWPPKSGSNETIAGTVLMGGYWYVVVIWYENEDISGPADYQLQVTLGETVSPPNCASNPVGDSSNIGDALLICPDQPVSGQINRKSDQFDVYDIHFPDNTYRIIELTGIGGDAQMGLFYPEATDVTKDTPVGVSGKPGNEERIIFRYNSSPGIWHIALLAMTDESTEYTLRVTSIFLGAPTAQGRAR